VALPQTPHNVGALALGTPFTIAACLLDLVNASIDGSQNSLKVQICISVHWAVFNDHAWTFERILLEQKIDASLTSADL